MNVPRRNWMLILGILLLSVMSVSAGRDGHVSLLRNTLVCGGICETVYEVCGNGDVLKLDSVDGYITFKSSKNAVLRTNDLFSEGRNIQYWVNDTTLSICDLGGNITGFCDKEYYRALLPYDKLIPATECVKLRVTGQFDKHDVVWVDNVLSLKIGGTIYDYTEFANWSNTDTTAFYQFNSSLLDGSGNANTMSMNGGSAIYNTTSKVTSSASFQLDGTAGQYPINITPTGAILGNSNFTVALWFQTDSPPSTTDVVRAIFGVGDNTNGANFKHVGMNYVNESGAWTLRVVGRGYSVNTGAIVINRSTWNSAIISYNSSDKNIRLYLNGDIVANGILGTALDMCEGVNDVSCVIKIGQQTNTGSGNEWIGSIDDFRLYNFVLNSSQRTNFINATYGWGSQSLDGESAAPPPPNPQNLVPNFTISPAIVPNVLQSNSSLNCSFTPFDDINSSLYANITWWHSDVLNGSFNSRVLCLNSSVCGSSVNVSGGLGVWTNWSCSVGLDEGVLGVLNFTNSSKKVVQNYKPKIQRLAFFNVTGVLGVSFRVHADIDVGGNDNDLLGVNFSYNRLYYPMTLNNNWTVLVNTTASTVAGSFDWNVTARDSFNNATTLIIQSRTINLSDDIRNVTKNRQVSLPVIAFSNNNYSVSLIDSVLVSNGNLLSRVIVQNHSLNYANFTTLAVYNQSGNNVSYNLNNSGFINWSQTFDKNSSQIFNITYNVTAIELYPIWENCTASSSTTGKCIITMNVTNRLPFIIDDFTVRLTDDQLPFFTKKTGDLRVFFNIINGSGGGLYMNNVLTGSSGIQRNFTDYEWSNATACQGEYCIQEDPQGGEITSSVIWGLTNASVINLSVTLNSTVINGSEIINFVLGSVTTTQDIGGLSSYQYQVVYDYDTQVADATYISGGGGGGVVIKELGNFSVGVTSIDDIWLPFFSPSDKVIVVVPNRVVSKCVVEGFDSCTIVGEKVMFTVPASLLSDKFIDVLSGSLTVFSESGDVASIPVLIRVYNPFGVFELKNSIVDPTNLFFTGSGVRLWWVLLLVGGLLFAFFKK